MRTTLRLCHGPGDVPQMQDLLVPVLWMWATQPQRSSTDKKTGMHLPANRLCAIIRYGSLWLADRQVRHRWDGAPDLRQAVVVRSSRRWRHNQGSYISPVAGKEYRYGNFGRDRQPTRDAHTRQPG